MIQINDNDLPIEVAAKIITGQRPNTNNELSKAAAKLLTGDEKAGEYMDMFSREEILEIADYLRTYAEWHENGD